MLKPKSSSPHATTAVDSPRIAPRALVPAPPPDYDLDAEVEVEETEFLDETLAAASAQQTSHELRPLGARVGLQETAKEILVLSDGRSSDTAPTVPATPRLRQTR